MQTHMQSQISKLKHSVVRLGPGMVLVRATLSFLGSDQHSSFSQARTGFFRGAMLLIVSELPEERESRSQHLTTNQLRHGDPHWLHPTGCKQLYWQGRFLQQQIQLFSLIVVVHLLESRTTYNRLAHIQRYFYNHMVSTKYLNISSIGSVQM